MLSIASPGAAVIADLLAVAVPTRPAVVDEGLVSISGGVVVLLAVVVAVVLVVEVAVVAVVAVVVVVVVAVVVVGRTWHVPLASDVAFVNT